jgi:hypothetical protein
VGALGELLEKFEAQSEQYLRNVIETDYNRLVDADELCFFGVNKVIPPSMEYLKSIGTHIAPPPEVYIVGLKNGKMIGPEKWYAANMYERLNDLAEWFQESLTKIAEVCEETDSDIPTVIKSAVVIDSEETFTRYEFDPIPLSPVEWATAADLAFDRWTKQIEEAGSAYALIKEN